ncbi:MAG: hypothetical protein GY888_18950 [Planctomycetaceae bacterium]|nr:hypothetical protein [Planctomycetaceae bacterium]
MRALPRCPGLRRQQSSLDAAALRTWRPWLPNVQVEGIAGSMDIQNYRHQMKAAQARDASTSSVSKYNQAQFRLLRATSHWPIPATNRGSNGSRGIVADHYTQSQPVACLTRSS